MSYAERLKGLREVNLAFAKADAKSGNKRAERKARRKLLRAAQEVEKKKMKKEDDLSGQLRQAVLAKKQARRLSIQRKKNEARLLRELAARLPDEEAANLNETFLQREMRLKDRARLLLKDQITDVVVQAKSLEEGQMGVAMRYMYRNVSYSKIIKWKLRRPLQQLSRAQHSGTRLILSKYTSMLLTEWCTRTTRDREEEEAPSSEDDWSESENEEEEEDNQPKQVVDAKDTEEEHDNDKMFRLILYLLNKTTSQINNRNGENATPSSATEHEPTLSDIHVSMWNALQDYFSTSPHDLKRLIDIGFVTAVLIFSYSVEPDVRHSASTMLKKLTLRYCFADTALLLVRSDAVEAVCSLAEGVSTGQPNNGGNSEVRSSDRNVGELFVGVNDTMKDEERERDVRNNCLAFLSNLSRYSVVSSRIVKRGGLKCVIDCIKWDRYASRNRHESDLLYLIAMGIISRCKCWADR
jgi:hypothetical protein